MPAFIVSLHKPAKWCFICLGANSTDAILDAYRIWAGHDKFEDAYEEAGSGNALVEQLKVEVFDCTELHRHDVLEYVERRLDGDNSINISL